MLYIIHLRITLCKSSNIVCIMGLWTIRWQFQISLFFNIKKRFMHIQGVSNVYVSWAETRFEPRSRCDSSCVTFSSLSVVKRCRWTFNQPVFPVSKIRLHLFPCLRTSSHISRPRPVVILPVRVLEFLAKKHNSKAAYQHHLLTEFLVEIYHT